LARPAILVSCVIAALLTGASAEVRAQDEPTPPERKIDPRVRLPSVDRGPMPVQVDRIAVRYVTPETGGNARPRFLSERELAFFARIEAAVEGAPIESDEYPERYVRAATDRLVARAMLASLLVQRGSEPPDLQRLAAEARSELAERFGGPLALDEALKEVGLDEAELAAFLRVQVRATHYVDRVITPIVAVTEDALREAYRSVVHPFRKEKFDDVRTKLKQWLVVERMRVAELEFLQGARARIRIAPVHRPESAGNVPR
jgi:hypothetical protein